MAPSPPDNATSDAGPAPARPDHARDRLLTAARELLSQAPMDTITVRMIAERAEAGHTLITRYYGSRRRLLTIAIGITLIELAQQIEAAPDAHAAVRSTFHHVLQSRELTSAINVATLDSAEQTDFPVVDALARHLSSAGATLARARERAATLTLMIFAWAAAEPRWLKMAHHADDPTTGRYQFQRTLLALVDDAIHPQPPNNPGHQP